MIKCTDMPHGADAETLLYCEIATHSIYYILLNKANNFNSTVKGHQSSYLILEIKGLIFYKKYIFYNFFKNEGRKVQITTVSAAAGP